MNTARANVRVKITPKKTIEAPPRTLIHGEPGIGKSTFAAGAPDVVFLCVEQGTNNLPIARARIEDESARDGERDPRTYDECITVLDSLIAGVSANKSKEPLFRYLAVDTVDALEGVIHAHVCRIGGKRSIGDFNYGKGFDITVDAFRQVFQRLEMLQELGVAPILIAHTKIETFQNPEGLNFDYYEIKCHKKVSGLLVEWSDNVLFARREQYALEEGGKVRGVGSGARFIHTQKTPAFIAKNRFDLPEKLPLNWSEYENAMRAHKPADPDELRSHAQQLIEKLEPEAKKSATEALAKIAKTDARTLAQFVDFCRSKLNISTHETPKTEGQ